MWSPLLLQTLHHHPCTQKTKITGLNDYRLVALTSVVKKSFERLVLAPLKDSTGPLLDPLQFAYRANRSVDDAVTQHGIALHPAASGKTRDLCEDPVCELQLRFQHQHLHLSVDHQLPDRQAAASEAGKTHIQHPHHQHWSSSGLCSLPTAIRSLHKWLHI